MTHLPWLTFSQACQFSSGPDLIDDLLPSQGTAMIYGGWSAGKSFLALDLALHVATGRPWAGREVMQCAVAYIAAEGGQAFRCRVKAWAQEHLSEDAEPPPFWLLPAPVGLLDQNATTSDEALDLIAELEALPETPRLTIIDTVARSLAGQDENQAGVMAAAAQVAQLIADRTGGLVILVHHAGKDRERGSRGSTALPAAMDVILKIERQGKIRTIVVEKCRDGEDGQSQSFNLRTVTIGTKPNGKPVTSCVIQVLDADDTVERNRDHLPPRAQKALSALHKALADFGEPSPGGKHYPPGDTVIRTDQWFDYFKRQNVAETDDLENAKRAFRDCKKILKDKSAIGEWDGLIWCATG